MPLKRKCIPIVFSYFVATQYTYFVQAKNVDNIYI